MADSSLYRDRRVLIAGLDPQLGGGVPAMMAAAARNIRQLGGSVSFVHLAQVGPRGLACERREWDGSPSFALSYRRTPNTFLNYVRPARRVRDLAASFDSLFLVGIPQSGVLFWPDGRPYRSWLATTVADEYAIRSWKSELHDRHWGWLLNRMMMPLTRAFEREVTRRSSDVFALSKSTQRSLIANYRVENSKVLPFPIDTRLFSPAQPARDPVVLYVGRVDDRRKNVALLLQAFRLVLNQIKDAELWLVGAYSPDGYVTRLTRDLRLGAAVRFLGVRLGHDLAEIYRRAAVFALPSRQEGLGIVVLEAMATGIAVVSTMCGGPEEDIRGSSAGVLVPQDDAKAFAVALTELLVDGKRRQVMRDHALQFIQHMHSDQAFQEVLTGERHIA